jgi:hypothetical protein
MHVILASKRNTIRSQKSIFICHKNPVSISAICIQYYESFNQSLRKANAIRPQKVVCLNTREIQPYEARRECLQQREVHL